MPRADSVISKRALGRIQRLCCLGLGGEVIVPDLVREIRLVVPSAGGYFRWAGSNLEPIKSYNETMPLAVKQLYIKEFYDRRERQVCRVFREILTMPESNAALHFWKHSLIVDRRTHLRSDFYNLIMRPSGMDEMLILRVRSMGQILGSLCVFRGEGDAPYTPGDLRLLESVAGFVAHGMTRETLADEVFVDGEDRGLLVTDPDGKVLHASFRAWKLLAMAVDSPSMPGREWERVHDPLPEIVRLRSLLKATANGEIGQPPPVLRRRTPWGEFVLRAYWLGPTDGSEATDRIGITIERRVPLALALHRRVEALALTAREKQLCLLLGRDPSRDDLPEVMGLTAQTVMTHQRSVYAKLGVHSRAELVGRLRSVSCP